MDIFQLKTIAPPSEEIKRAVKARQWNTKMRLVKPVTGLKRTQSISSLIKYLLREGYLILRHDNQSDPSIRDQFVNWLSNEASNLLAIDEQKELERGLHYAMLMEKLYQQASNESAKLLGTNDPAQAAWASITLAHKEYVRWYRSAIQSLDQSDNGDVLSVKSRPNTNYPERTLSEIAFALDVALSRELRLLGMMQNWFHDTLEIPEYTEPLPESVATMRFNAAATFDQIENSDTRYRLFGGDYCASTAPMLPNDNTKKSIVAISFPVHFLISIHVAGLRFSALYLRQSTKAIRNRNQTHRPINTDPLDQLIALEQYIFQELTGLNVASNHQRFDGLTVAEWLTGIAFLSSCAQGYLSSRKCHEMPLILPREELQNHLSKGGMQKRSEQSLHQELHIFSPQHRPARLPLISIHNDMTCLQMFPAKSQSSARLVLSQFAKKRIQIGNKGEILERRLLTL